MSIAAPRHLHFEHFVAALGAGKIVYQEKTMAFTIDHAKRMRAAFQRAGKPIVQGGLQSCSMGQVADARSFLDSGNIGGFAFLHAHRQTFLDCIRTGKEPDCLVELAFRVSFASRLAVDTYRSRKSLTRDPKKEEID